VSVARPQDLVRKGSFLRCALFGQPFLTSERDAGRNSACNDIAHFPGWSDQQAKLAENQMSFFEVGSSWRFGHEDFRLPGNPDTMRRRKRGNTNN
jgi:hypothetical protein